MERQSTKWAKYLNKYFSKEGVKSSKMFNISKHQSTNQKYMTYHHEPIRMVLLKKKTITKHKISVGVAVDKLESFALLLGM